MSQNSKSIFKAAVEGIHNHSQEITKKTDKHLDAILAYISVIEKEYNDVQESLGRANAIINQYQSAEAMRPVSQETREFRKKF